MFPRSAATANTWSLHDIRRLRELAQAGLPIESIAAALGRSRAAIRNKAGFHAISLRRRSGAAQERSADVAGGVQAEPEDRVCEQALETRGSGIRSAAGGDAGAHARLHQ
jgi:hypothetical protein